MLRNLKFQESYRNSFEVSKEPKGFQIDTYLVALEGYSEGQYEI